MAWRVGVDIGGTFTDVAVINEATGRTGIAKVSTTPHDFDEGVVDGLKQAIEEQGVVPAEVSFVSHATTVVTNALLQGKGARVALVCTKGFRDLLELRRSARSDLYDINQDAPSVLVPRHCRLEVDERIDAQGEVVKALETTSEYEVGGQGNVNRWMNGTGHPIRVPVVDLAEVSAGGGSIAWIDPGGALRVGPESAGAAPGPACYGLGGSRPTVTDADVVLGYLNPAHLLGAV